MDEITYDNVVEMEEFKNKKRKDTPTKINFNPHNGLPVTTLLTYEDVFGKIPGTNNTSSGNTAVTCKEKTINNFSSIPREWFHFTGSDDDSLPPAC